MLNLRRWVEATAEYAPDKTLLPAVPGEPRGRSPARAPAREVRRAGSGRAGHAAAVVQGRRPACRTPGRSPERRRGSGAGRPARGSCAGLSVARDGLVRVTTATPVPAPRAPGVRGRPGLRAGIAGPPRRRPGRRRRGGRPRVGPGAPGARRARDRQDHRRARVRRRGRRRRSRPARRAGDRREPTRRRGPAGPALGPAAARRRDDRWCRPRPPRRSRCCGRVPRLLGRAATHAGVRARSRT